MLPQEKCRVYRMDKVIDKPVYGLRRADGTKIYVCLNYCIYGLEGKKLCDKWRG
jgi:hypothetical protein